MKIFIRCGSDRAIERARRAAVDATRACAIDPAGLASRAGRGDLHKEASRERANLLASWLRCRLVMGGDQCQNYTGVQSLN